MTIIKVPSTTVATMNQVENPAAYCSVLLKIHLGIQLVCITVCES